MTSRSFLSFKSITTIMKFEIREHLRNKWLISYCLLFFVLANLIIYLGGAHPLQASGSLLSLVLLLVPIFTLVFGSISFTEALAFLELLCAQPIKRSEIYIGKCLGLGLSLGMAFLIGLGSAAAIRIQAADNGLLTFLLLLLLGFVLSFVFVFLSFFIANLSNRKEVVFSLALSLWFYFFVLHDLIIFGIIANYGEYPLEAFVFIASLINPIDLSRVMVSLQMDVSELMGASGAVMKMYLGGTVGAAVGVAALTLWSALPLLAGIRLFNKRDL